MVEQRCVFAFAMVAALGLFVQQTKPSNGNAMLQTLAAKPLPEAHPLMAPIRRCNNLKAVLEGGQFPPFGARRYNNDHATPLTTPCVTIPGRTWHDSCLDYGASLEGAVNETAPYFFPRYCPLPKPVAPADAGACLMGRRVYAAGNSIARGLADQLNAYISGAP